MTPEEIVKAAKPTTVTVELCMDAELLAEYQVLERRLAALQARKYEPASLGETDQRVSIATRMRELEADMAERVIVFRFRSLPRAKFLALRDEHPPREGRDEPANVDTLAVPLIRACCVEPDFDRETWDRLFDEVLSDGQVETLFNVAFTANTGQIQRVPFSPLASAVLRGSEQS